MKSVLLAVFCFLALVCFSSGSFDRWYYPSDPKDSYWDQIYAYVPDSVKDECNRIRSIDDVDIIVSRFDSITQTLPVKSKNGKKFILWELFSSPDARVISSLDIFSGIGLWHVPTNEYYSDRIPKFIDWYQRNREKIDIPLLKRHIAAYYYLINISWWQCHYCGIDTLTMLDSITCARLYDIMKFEDDFFHLEFSDKNFIDSILQIYPDIELINRRIRADKNSDFVLSWCHGIWKDDTLQK